MHDDGKISAMWVDENDIFGREFIPATGWTAGHSINTALLALNIKVATGDAWRRMLAWQDYDFINDIGYVKAYSLGDPDEAYLFLQYYTTELEPMDDASNPDIFISPGDRGMLVYQAKPTGEDNFNIYAKIFLGNWGTTTLDRNKRRQRHLPQGGHHRLRPVCHRHLGTGQ